MRKFYFFVSIISFAFVLILILFNVTLDNKVTLLKYYELRHYGKSKIGGVVINSSAHNIKVTDFRKRKVIPPGKTSRDLGVFDADIIVIDKPTIFEGKVYSDGYIKLCDFATMEVTSKDKMVQVSGSITYNFCKFFEYVGWFSHTEGPAQRH